MRKSRKRVISVPELPSTTEGWMLTLSDMLLLLLTFFVLLISMSSFDSGLLTEAFGGPQPGSSGVLNSGTTIPIVVSEQRPQQSKTPKDLAYYRRLSRPLSRLLNKLERRLGKALLKVEVLDGNLELEIMSDKLFGTLDDNLKPQGEEALFDLGGFLQKWSGLLEVEIYTDNFPLHTARFPDNNVLAARRGERVVKYLSRSGVKESQFLLAAYGADRAVVVNDTPQHRQRNRRIIFRLPKWVELAGVKES